MLPRAVELEIDDACIWFIMSREFRFVQEQLMDTKYFQKALEEYALKKSAHIKAGDLTVGELSWLLRRAQEMKAVDEAAQFEARRGTCAWCGRRDFTTPCDSPLGHKLYEVAIRAPQPAVNLLDHAEEIR